MKEEGDYCHVIFGILGYRLPTFYLIITVFWHESILLQETALYEDIALASPAILPLA